MPELSPEQINLIEAGALEEDVQDAIEDVEQVAVALAGRLEARHDEILREVTECRNRLDELSTQLQKTPAESPLLNRLMEELILLRAEVTSLKSFMDSMRSNPLPSESEPMPVQIVEVESPSEPRAEELTVEPLEEEPEPEAEKRRKYKTL